MSLRDLVYFPSYSVKLILYFVVTGFDLTTWDSYFTILAEVFTNHILAENVFHESYRVNRTADYGLKTRKQMSNHLVAL